MAFVVDQRVVIVQFFAGRDIAHGVDVDAPVLLEGLAVGRAGVVDPARGVAAAAAIDDAAVGQGEVEGVVDRAAGLFRAPGRLVPGDALAPVLDDALARADGPEGEYALAVDGGLPDFTGGVWLGGASGRGHRCKAVKADQAGGTERATRASVLLT